MPETSLRKIMGNISFGGFPYMPGVKYIQFVMRNPMLRSKIANSGNQGKTYCQNTLFDISLFIS